jgi:uncharacterized OB-fold protein
MMEETRIVQGKWELSTFKFRLEGDGIQLMLDSMKDAKLKGLKCHECGTIYCPAPFYCRKCHVLIHDEVEVSDHGEIMTYTVGYADVRGEPLAEPQVSAMVKLDGCDSWFMGVVHEVDPEDVHVGMRVKLKWNEERVGSLQDMEAFVPE